MLMPLHMAIIAGALFCTVAGQLLFKGAALAANTYATWLNPRSLTLFCTAICLYMAMTFLWTTLLREVSVSKAFPFMALAYLIIPVSEALLFGQAFQWNALLGGAIIAAGIVVTQL